jgi:hypothetical protein
MCGRFEFPNICTLHGRIDSFVRAGRRLSAFDIGDEFLNMTRLNVHLFSRERLFERGYDTKAY